MGTIGGKVFRFAKKQSEMLCGALNTLLSHFSCVSGGFDCLLWRLHTASLELKGLL